MASWNARYVVLLLALFAVAVVCGTYFDMFRFNPVSGQSIVSLLTPLFVISLFVERMIEVFVGSWRGIELAAHENAVKEAEVALEQHPLDPATQTTLAEAKAELAQFKACTRRIAFLAGISSGVVISAVGVRCIQPLTDMDAEMVGSQGMLFHFVDIVVTGGLIGGGSEGIHRVVSVITDFLDKTRANINQGK